MFPHFWDECRLRRFDSIFQQEPETWMGRKNPIFLEQRIVQIKKVNSTHVFFIIISVSQKPEDSKLLRNETYTKRQQQVLP